MLRSACIHITLRFSMRPDLFGYPTGADWAQDAKDATLKKLREAILTNELPRYMEYYTNLIKEAVVMHFYWEKISLSLLPILQLIKISLSLILGEEWLIMFLSIAWSYPEVLAFLKRVEEHPKVATYKASKA